MRFDSIKLNAERSKKQTIYLQGSIRELLSEQTLGLTRFKLLAYSGAEAVIPALPYPVVFELSSLKKGQNTPLLWSHNRDIIVGHTESLDIHNTNGVTGVGVISGVNERAKEINATAKNGFPWQLSIGVTTDTIIFYKKGESFNANGRSFIGPKYLAKEGFIHEVSFCPAGGDSNTLAVLQAAYSDGNSIMNFDQWLAARGIDPTTLDEAGKALLQQVYDSEVAEGIVSTETPPVDPNAVNGQNNANANVAANATGRTSINSVSGSTNGNNANSGTRANTQTVTQTLDANAISQSVVNSLRTMAADEQTRLDSIKRLSAAYNNPRDEKGNYIQVTAMKEGWTLEKTELHMLRAARPNTVILGGDNGGQHHLVLECAVAQSGKLPNVEKLFSPQTLEIAHKKFHNRIGLQELILECAYANGYTGTRNFKAGLRNLLASAFSTLDISGVFSNTANKYLVAGFESVDETWRKIARIGSVPDFKEITGYRGVGSFRFDQIAPDGQIPHGKINETSYGNKADTYAKMFAIPRTAIINDDLGFLTGIPKGLGRGAALQLNFIFWTEFLDNSTFFVAGNNNVSAGALSITGLTNAWTAFRKLKDEDGDFVLAEPKYLLVPSELYPTASTLNNSTATVSGTGTTPTPANNPWAGKFEPIESPYLSDSRFVGFSTTAYYLLADPNDVSAIEVVFLDGVEKPTIESADVDFNRLGIQMRGYYDFGVRLQEFRSGVRSTGV